MIQDYKHFNTLIDRLEFLSEQKHKIKWDDTIKQSMVEKWKNNIDELEKRVEQLEIELNNK